METINQIDTQSSERATSITFYVYAALSALNDDDYTLITIGLTPNAMIYRTFGA